MTYLVTQTVKSLPADPGLIPQSGRSPGIPPRNYLELGAAPFQKEHVSLVQHGVHCQLTDNNPISLHCLPWELLVFDLL